MYEYRCKVIKVIDGDTVDCTVDLGFRVAMAMRVRLAGINAPEMRTAEGMLAKARLMELMPIGATMKVLTMKDKQEKYGRYLGTFSNDEGNDINARMVTEGYATVYPLEQ